MTTTPHRPRLDTATAANLLLVTFLILYVILPGPWDGIAGAAAVAALAAMFVARYVWPKPEPEPGPPTGETVTQVTAHVRDLLDGYQMAGFTEDEAKQMVRDQLMAQQPKTTNLRPMNGGKTS